MTELKPRYNHNCHHCVLIGQYDDYDLYHCLMGGSASEGGYVVVRNGAYARNAHSSKLISAATHSNHAIRRAYEIVTSERRIAKKVVDTFLGTALERLEDA
jgi:hypothetical protein